MRSVLFSDKLTENDLLNKLSKCKKNNDGYITSNCLFKASVDDIFIKKLNTDKIRHLYKGDYFNLFNEYYNKIKNILNTNQIFGLLEIEGEVYEFSKFIDKENFLDDTNSFEWKDILELFELVLEYINNCVKYNIETSEIIGFETAIWNFTISGMLFDLDPPKILRKFEDSSFTRKEDENHIKRTLYRSFDETGMKANLLVTILLGEKHNSYIIKNKPKNYIDVLIRKMFDSFIDRDKCINLHNGLMLGLSEKESFVDHPIKLLRREYMRRERLKEKEIVFVAGTSESGKSGGINYILDNHPEVQHIKIRDVFPLIYKDTLTNLSFDEWQDREEKRDLNNFWNLFINKLAEIAQDDKKVIILDTMYGVNGMKELYKILGDKVHLLYIDAPFEDRVIREYKRLRIDSVRGNRKADLSVTLDEVAKRTIKKDSKKNKFGADKLPFLCYSVDEDDKIEVNNGGEIFTDIINNNSTIVDFHNNLDKYLDKILMKQNGKVKKKIK